MSWTGSTCTSWKTVALDAAKQTPLMIWRQRWASLLGCKQVQEVQASDCGDCSQLHIQYTVWPQGSVVGPEMILGGWEDIRIQLLKVTVWLIGTWKKSWKTGRCHRSIQTRIHKFVTMFMFFMLADSSQTSIFGKVNGQLLHACWWLLSDSWCAHPTALWLWDQTCTNKLNVLLYLSGFHSVPSLYKHIKRIW